MIKGYWKNFLFYYFPLVLWMGGIFYLSSIPGLKTGAALPVEIILRKTAHLLEYAFLSFLFWRIFYNLWGFDFLRSGVLAFLATVLYASTDEFHQYFVENRAGRWEDVLLDSGGGFLGIVFSRIFFAKKEK